MREGETLNQRSLRCAGLARVALGALLLVLSSLTVEPHGLRAEPTTLGIGATYSGLNSAGFCLNGVHSEIGMPEGPLVPRGITVVGSYCAKEGAGTGETASESFKAPAELTLFIGGYLDVPGMGLLLQDAEGAELDLVPYPSPNRSWRDYTFSVPENWRGRSVRLVARDQSTASQGWFAFTEPVRLGASAWLRNLKDASLLTLLTLAELAVLAVPLLAGCVMVVRSGIRGTISLVTSFLLMLGGMGYALFWIYLASPIAGIAASLLLIAAGGGFLLMWKRNPGYQNERAALAPLARLLALCATLTMLVVQLGFQFGGVSRAQDVPGHRFTHPMPGDDSIPKQFADGLFAGRVPHPLHATYLSSDRPPLQTGIFLLERPLVGGTVNLTYEIFGVFLQTLWVLGLWAWLKAARVAPGLAVLILVTCLVWGFTLVNTFYVWPKLFPAAFLFLLAGTLLSDRYRDVRDNPWVGACTGLAAAFAMLSHGVSVFGVAGVGLAMLLRGRLPGPRFLAAGALAAAGAYIPWMAYQAFIDPPGNALLKLHLAGLDPDDPRGTFAAITAGYAALPFHTWVANKLANFTIILGPLPEYWLAVGRLTGALVRLDFSEATRTATLLRRYEFFSLGPALGVLAVGPVVLSVSVLWKRLRKVRAAPDAGARSAAISWLCVLSTIAFWVLVQFGPGTTILQSGPFLLPILAAAACIAGTWAIAPSLATTLCVAQILLQTLIYVALIPGTSAHAVVGTAFNPFCAGVAAIAGVILARMIWRIARSEVLVG